MDQRRGCAQARPSRARPLGHDPGRARHLSRRRARGSMCACPGSKTSRRAARLLTRGDAVEGWETLSSPQDVFALHDVNDLLVEGGSATATAFLSADLVDRILIYRAPILVGEGKSSFGYIGLDGIADAHGRWRACRRPGARHRPARSLRAGPRQGLGRHVHRDHHRHRHRPQRRAARRPAADDRLRLRSVDRRSRRVDRLLGRLPDGGRQGRGLVRGRCLP